MSRANLPCLRKIGPIFGLLPFLFLTACGGNSSSVSGSHSAPHSKPVATEASLASPARSSYAALGDSVTYGIGAAPHTLGYAYRVARQLRAKRFVNEGVPGSTIDQGYTSELTGALSIRPQLCTVFFGFNDLRAGVPLSSFLRDLRDLIETLRRAQARVLVVGLPDLALLPAVRAVHLAGVGAIVRSWDSGERRVAKQAGASFVGLASFDKELSQHPNYISGDGLHPSNRGHLRLAEVVLADIAKERLWSR